MLPQKTGYYLLHPATFLFASTAIVIGAGNLLWQEYGDRICEKTSAAITSGGIAINNPGSWATPGTARIVTDRIESLGLTLNDQGTVPTIAKTLEEIPAIEQIRTIRKSPDGVKLDVKWRQPAAVIRMPSGYFRLVDRTGIILDRQAKEESEALEWLRIALPRVDGEDLADWQRWPDKRVIQAAGIAAEISGVWQEFGIRMVVTFRLPESLVGPQPGYYELWSWDKPVVIWSDDGPSSDPELTARKIAAVRSWIITHGALDQLSERNYILDVRSGAAREVPSSNLLRTSDVKDWLLF